MDLKQRLNLRVKTLDKLVPDPALHRLAVHFFPHGMAMLWMGKEDRKPLAFQVSDAAHDLDLSSDDVIRDLIRFLQSSHPWFTNTSVPVTALVPGSGISLVPEPLYDSFMREKLTALSLMPGDGETLAAEKLTHAPVYAVFTLPWSWNQQFRTHFLDHTLVHEDFHWINATHGKGKAAVTAGDRGIMLRFPGRVKILLIHDGKPAAFNTYGAQSPEDCLYWLLLLTEQSGMKPAETEVEVVCNESDESSLLSLFRNYFPVVNQADRIFPGRNISLFKGVRTADWFQLLSMVI